MKQNYIEYCPKHANTQSSTNLSKFKNKSEDYANDIITPNKIKNSCVNQSNNGQKSNQKISKSSSFSLLFKNKENVLQRQFSENVYIQNNYSKEKKNIKNTSLQHSMSINFPSNSFKKILESNCPKHSKALPEFKSTLNIQTIDNQYKKKNFIDRSIQTDVFLNQNYLTEYDNFYKQKNFCNLDENKTKFFKTSYNSNEYNLYDNQNLKTYNSNLNNYNPSLTNQNSNLNNYNLSNQNLNKYNSIKQNSNSNNIISYNSSVNNIANISNQCSLIKHKIKNSTDFYYLGNENNENLFDLRANNQYFNNDFTKCNLDYCLKDQNFTNLDKNLNEFEKLDFLINFNDCERNNYENDNWIIDNQNIEKLKKIKELKCEEIERKFNKNKPTDSIFFPLKKNETQYQNKSFENIVHKDENYMYLLDKFEKNSDQKSFNSTYSSIYEQVNNNLNSKKCSFHQFESANNEIPLENFSFQINKKNLDKLNFFNKENFYISTENFKNYNVSKLNENFFQNIECLDKTIEPVFCDLTYENFSDKNLSCDLKIINNETNKKNFKKYNQDLNIIKKNKPNANKKISFFFQNKKSKTKFYNFLKTKKPINLSNENNLSSFINVSFRNLNQFRKNFKIKSNKNKINKKSMLELQSKKKIIKRKHIKKGGIKSKPIKFITHPLERSLIGFFLITLFFTILAIISGLPIVCILCLCLPIAACIRNLASCDFCVNMFLNYQKCTPSEIYWLNSPWKNNCKKGQAICLIMVDDGFTLEQCRDLIQSRLINKIGTERFRWLLRFKGLFKLPYWKRIPINEFLIDDHITELKSVDSTVKLKEYIMKIMHIKLNLTVEPGWHIHYVHMPNQNQVALIIQFHQALFDGINLSKILISLICDQATVFPLAEQHNFEKLTPNIAENSFNNLSFNDSIYPYLKPRFGGFNFSVNICRAVIVGPLTFILWLIWAITRRDSNFLKSSKFFLNLNKFVDTININLISRCYDESDSEKLINDKLKLQNDFKQTSSKTTNENNLDNVNKEKKYLIENPEKTIHWVSYPFSKVQRIKQVTRSSLNDVILSCIAGAIRTYLIKNCNLFNPPDLCVSLPVDISVANDNDMENIGVNYVFLTAPLPTSVESSIPRLWEIRHLMEELKTSADPAVMVGVNFFLHWLLPSFLSKLILNFIHRNSSVCLSNLQGPKNQITFYTNRVHSIHYWMSPPPNIPLCFNVFSYGDSLEISISSSASLFPSAEKLAVLLDKQFQIYFKLLGKRRIPGEHSKIKAFTKNYLNIKNSSQNLLVSSALAQNTQDSVSRTIKDELNASLISLNDKYKASTSTDSLNSISLPIPGFNEKNCLISQLEELNFYSKKPNLESVSNLTIGQLADELDYIQTQIFEISAQVKMVNDINRKNQLELELNELRESFTILMRYVKRRKSFADHSLHNVSIKIEEDIDDEIENDGGLRLTKKRFSFGVPSRRSSVVSTSIIPIPPSRFQVSPPNLLSRRSLIPTSSPDSISSQEHSMKEETV